MFFDLIYPLIFKRQFADLAPFRSAKNFNPFIGQYIKHTAFQIGSAWDHAPRIFLQFDIAAVMKKNITALARRHKKQLIFVIRRESLIVAVKIRPIIV